MLRGGNTSPLSRGLCCLVVIPRRCWSSAVGWAPMALRQFIHERPVGFIDSLLRSAARYQWWWRITSAGRDGTIAIIKMIAKVQHLNSIIICQRKCQVSNRINWFTSVGSFLRSLVIPSFRSRSLRTALRRLQGTLFYCAWFFVTSWPRRILMIGLKCSTGKANL